MTLFSTVCSINHFSILEEYKKLEEKIHWPESSAKGRQSGIQYATDEDPESSAVGRLKTNRTEQEYNVVNPLFQNTIFEEIVKEYKLVRTRLMWVNPYSCYSIHRDKSWRLHIPLITNTECLFVFPDHQKFIHLPAGKVYNVDTTKNHSFCNFSATPRLHIVGCLAN